MIRRGLVLSAAYLVIVVLAFLLFGLGLEGHSIGRYLLPALMEPMLSLFGGRTTGGATFITLFFINSLFWGFALAWLVDLLRRLRA